MSVAKALLACSFTGPNFWLHKIDFLFNQKIFFPTHTSYKTIETHALTFLSLISLVSQLFEKNFDEPKMILDTVDLHPSMLLATLLQWYIFSASAHSRHALHCIRRRGACQLNKCTTKEVSLRTYCPNTFTVSLDLRSKFFNQREYLE